MALEDGGGARPMRLTAFVFTLLGGHPSARPPSSSSCPSSGDPWQRDPAASLPGRAGRRRSGGGGWVSLKPFARSGGENGGLALYSPSHPAQVGGEEPPRSQN